MLKERYLLLMRDMLIGVHGQEMVEKTPVKNTLLKAVNNLLNSNNLGVYRQKKHTAGALADGHDFVGWADTMIGVYRLFNIKHCLEEIIENKIEGDVIECGVWRGGASIYMKAILEANNDKRKLWLADSFCGLPKPDKRYPADANDIHYKQTHLSVPLDEVKANFQKYYLLDENVKFLEGWFKDTLPTAPIEKLALLRIDADMYEGTMDCLVNLYHKVSEGGFVIIDDYALAGCRKAVNDFREKNNITTPIIKIDWTGVYWRK